MVRTQLLALPLTGGVIFAPPGASVPWWGKGEGQRQLGLLRYYRAQALSLAFKYTLSFHPGNCVGVGVLTTETKRNVAQYFLG